MRPAEPRHVGDTLPITLSADTARRLDEVGRAHGVTRFMTLLAAFQLMLGRYAGVRDVSVGTPVSGRPRPELDGLVGFFVNTLVLRTRWADEPTFAELLERVREATLGAHEHQDVPFEEVVDALRPPRDLSRTPLFQVALATRTAPVTPEALPGLLVALREAASRVAKFDLTVFWDETVHESGELRGVVEYDVDLFDRATVERMMAHYVALLESALARPGARVFELAHTTPAERVRLADWGTEPTSGRPENLAAGFLAQAIATPDAVALVFDGETVTYDELRARAEHLADLLADRGVDPESVVALAMDRSASLVVAMLAVLLAGAAYLPLDAGNPQARLEFMVADSGASLLIADRTVGFAGDVPVVRIDELASPAGHRSRRARPAVHREQRACVFYTSGSTGTPKGVEVTHRGIVRLVCDAGYLGFAESDVVAQVANVSFDAATLEVWGALLNGGRTVGIRKEEALTPELLRERVAAHGVTAMFLTTAVFNQCVDAAPEMFAPVRTLLFGGEEADPRRVAALRAALPELRLVHAYGPTECTTFTSTHDVVAVAADAARVPIGRPIPGTSVHVLDEYARDAGIGVPGEVYIGGPGVARGYTGRPGLTAARFLPSPFGVGERLYRTGDLARWREDGVIEYLGRADTQVKIRGVRIEPEEVASVLATCDGVRAAVVDVQGDRDSKHLVAYVVADGTRPVEPWALRAHLAARLPEAMVPAWYVPLLEVPLTANGKLDRRALPAPTERDGVQSATYVAPRDTTEELVAQVWAELLDVANVSVARRLLRTGRAFPARDEGRGACLGPARDEGRHA